MSELEEHEKELGGMCSVCGEEYETKEEAQKCEDRCEAHLWEEL